MAITKKQGREALARIIGAWLPATATTSGAADGSTVIASRFVVPAAYVAERKNAYKGYYLLLTSGALTGAPEGTTPVFSQVVAFDATLGTFTVAPAFAGQVASGVTFELHAFSPELFTVALNKTCGNYRKYIFKPLYDSSITLTAGTWEYAMPTGITSDMISRVMMEGGETGATYDNVPDPNYPIFASYAQDDSKIWLNRGMGAKSIDVITGRKLYLIGKNYLTAFAKDTTYGALVTDLTAGAELTENTEAHNLFLEYAAKEHYLLLASGPAVQNRAQMIALSKEWELRAQADTPRQRMREPDWNAVGAL